MGKGEERMASFEDIGEFRLSRMVGATLSICVRALLAAASLLLLVPATTLAQGLPDLRDRTEREWEIESEKMRERLAPTMREHGVDLWVVMSHENDPDPAVELFGGYGKTGFYGFRHAYLFHAPDEGSPLETVALGTHLSGHLTPFYDSIINYGREGLAPHLKRFVHRYDPDTIAVNRSPTIAMADGLSIELHKYLKTAIGPEYSDRLVSSEQMFIDYVSRRTPAELKAARKASEITWNILRRTFSAEVIEPGETTLMDLHWWVRDQWEGMDLSFNFPSSFDLQRRGGVAISDEEDPVIRPGDLLHVDFGVKLMGIVTDQQKMAYVLRPGETRPPAGLRKAFRESSRMVEIVAESLEPGIAGIRVQEQAERRGRKVGIRNSVYSHTQGNWVHGAGAWAIWDWPDRYGKHPQEPVRQDEFWSVELRTTGSVPEWDGQDVNMYREEDAWIDDQGQVRFMTGPQEELWVIGQPDTVYTGDGSP